jgi:hypothetical protein
MFYVGDLHFLEQKFYCCQNRVLLNLVKIQDPQSKNKNIRKLK